MTGDGMKRLVALCCVVCAWAGTLQAETTVQVRMGTSGFEFGFLYSDYYHVEAPVVQRCTAVLSEADFLVALHLARASGASIEVVVDMRRRGLSWFDITHRCMCTTQIYFVDIPDDPGPPYGRAWGHWRKNRRDDFEMSDDEIRAFVQLSALSQHGKKSPAEVMRLRKSGKSPAEIVGAKKKAAEDTAPAAQSKSSDKPGKGKSKNKGKKH
jgi:hypothetical protein